MTGKFIISYYIRDFTVAVYEAPVRNSGIMGGQLLKRSRVEHPDQGEQRRNTVREPAAADLMSGLIKVGLYERVTRFYEAADFYIGANFSRSELLSMTQSRAD